MLRIFTSKFVQLLGGLYLTIGAFWVIVVVLNEGTHLLLGPAIVSLITSSTLLVGLKGSFIRCLSASTGLYNFILFAYQAYLSLSLISLSLLTSALLMAFGYGVVAFLLFIALLIIYSRPKVFSS